MLSQRLPLRTHRTGSGVRFASTDLAGDMWSRARVTSKVSRVLLSQQLKVMNDAGIFGSVVFEVRRGVL